MANAKRRRELGKEVRPAFGFGYQAADAEESEDSQFSVENDFKRIEDRARRFQ